MLPLYTARSLVLFLLVAGAAAGIAEPGRASADSAATITVTAASASMTYGGAAPAIGYSVSLPPSADAPAIMGSPDCAADVTAASPVGVYDTSCSAGTLSASGYSLDFVGGTVTVEPAPLTVKASSAECVFQACSSTLGSLSGTITGLVGADSVTATYASSATTASPAAAYTVTPQLSDGGSGVLSNYTVSGQDGTLSVDLAPADFTFIVAVVTSSTSVSFSSRLVSGVNGNPIAGRRVTYQLKTGHSIRSCSGTTSSMGAASCGLSHLPKSHRQRSLTVSFAGDSAGAHHDFSGQTVTRSLRIG